MQVVLGTTRKARGRGPKRRLVEKEECMVYVPILKSLEVLLGNEQVLSEVSLLVQVCVCVCVLSKDAVQCL